MFLRSRASIPSLGKMLSYIRPSSSCLPQSHDSRSPPPPLAGARYEHVENKRNNTHKKMLVLQCSLTVLTLRTWKTRLVTPFPLAEGLSRTSSPLPVRRRGDPDDARKQGAAERGEPIGNEEGVSGPALRAASFCS